MLKHTVQFRLKDGIDENEKKSFFAAVMLLKAIDGVNQFELMQQVSEKNRFGFNLSMVFESRDVYAHYNSSPDHVQFINEQWMPKVDSFLEADFVEMSPFS